MTHVELALLELRDAKAVSMNLRRRAIEAQARADLAREKLESLLQSTRQAPPLAR
jgi:hypothetical protein